jgi:hypothetical protein
VEEIARGAASARRTQMAKGVLARLTARSR